MFTTRLQAGRLLAESKSLQKFRAKSGAIVLGIPRGGMVTAACLAESLGVPLDVIVTRKITAPSNPEYAIGAVGETGPAIWNDDVAGMFSVQDKKIMEATARQEAARRTSLYRRGKQSINIKGNIVILVDDGLATGLTMEAAILEAKKLGAREVIVATPVAPPDTIQKLERNADTVVVGMQPAHFMAVGQFYQEFPQVSDREVLALLRKYGQSGSRRRKREVF